MRHGNSVLFFSPLCYYIWDWKLYWKRLREIQCGERLVIYEVSAVKIKVQKVLKRMKRHHLEILIVNWGISSADVNSSSPFPWSWNVEVQATNDFFVFDFHAVFTPCYPQKRNKINKLSVALPRKWKYPSNNLLKETPSERVDQRHTKTAAADHYRENFFVKNIYYIYFEMIL